MCHRCAELAYLSADSVLYFDVMFGSCNMTAIALLTTAIVSTTPIVEAFVVTYKSAPHRHATSSQHLLGSTATSTPFVALSLQQQRRQNKQQLRRSPEHRNTRDELHCHLDNGDAGNEVMLTSGRLAGWRKTTPNVTQRHIVLHHHHRRYDCGLCISSRQRRDTIDTVVRSPLARLTEGEGGLSGHEGKLGGAAGGEGDESNALLLRVDFEDAEVEELRQWIRR